MFTPEFWHTANFLDQILVVPELGGLIIWFGFSGHWPLPRCALLMKLPKASGSSSCWCVPFSSKPTLASIQKGKYDSCCASNKSGGTKSVAHWKAEKQKPNYPTHHDQWTHWHVRNVSQALSQVISHPKSSQVPLFPVNSLRTVRHHMGDQNKGIWGSYSRRSTANQPRSQRCQSRERVLSYATLFCTETLVKTLLLYIIYHSI